MILCTVSAWQRSPARWANFRCWRVRVGGHKRGGRHAPRSWYGYPGLLGVLIRMRVVAVVGEVGDGGGEESGGCHVEEGR